MKFEYVHCNICGGNETKPLGKRQGPGNEMDLETNIVQCSSCGLLYPNPMPRKDWNEIQESFKNPEYYFSGAVTDKRIEKCEKIIRIIERIKPDKGALLDVGCGRGELVYVAAKRNWRAVGTEVSESFAQYAKEKFNIDVLLGDLDKLDFPRENFDVVSLNSVIQYVANPLSTLRKINSLLKENGILYIEVTNENALVFKIGDFFKSLKIGERVTTRLSPLFPSFQIYGFNKKSLSSALEKTGFEILNFEVKGITGGGELRGRGLNKKVVNFIRKVIILIGGITGNGHLIYCLAKKGE